MPGKVNPVMTEAVMQAGMAVRANDAVIAECAAHGTLQINEFMPLLAWALLESIDILDATARAFAGHVTAIEANRERCAAYLEDGPSLLTAFLPQIGYERASILVKEFALAHGRNSSLTLRSFLCEKLGEALVNDVLSASNLIKLGHD
jgi:aspartate ammonia-lyase